jgi:hypothetical protein
MVEERNAQRIFVTRREGKDHLQDLDVVGRILK